MFDYQHKHLPHLFSEEECNRRDEKFAGMLAAASAVIVNSRDTQTDIETFNPDHASKIIALPFTPLPNPAWFAADNENVVQKYKLPKRYFLISNQFWRHKSHITAFEALALLQRNADIQDVQIVCTGEMRDSRHPNYFSELEANIVGMGLRNAVSILGHIPKIDQIQIMKNAVAVVQPTLFEGGPGGGSVFDAMALGIRAIISDIPVNREIEDANATFFTTGSVPDLAEKMAIALSEEAPQIDGERQLELARQRTAVLGGRLLEAAACAREKHLSQARELGS
jgi:glycosyltransferase involved in cell wall biosynthesis